MNDFIKNILKGGIIGIANAIPGVSGGTMAVVLGIYDRLIGSVGGFLKDPVANVKFLLPIGIGAGAGIVLFGSLIEFLITHYPTPTNIFFAILIIYSIPSIYRKALSLGSPKSYHYGAMILWILIMIALAIFGGVGSNQIITELSLSTSIYLASISFVAAVGMLLPGVSGSMLLLMLGGYYTIISAVSNLDIIMLLPVAAGIGLGLLVGAVMINFCLEKFPLITYWSIIGLVLGSIISVVQNAQLQTASTTQLYLSAFVVIVVVAVAKSISQATHP